MPGFVTASLLRCQAYTKKIRKIKNPKIRTANATWKKREREGIEKEREKERERERERKTETQIVHKGLGRGRLIE